MGRVGAGADNAAMESFFSMLQKDVLNHRWTSQPVTAGDHHLDQGHLPLPLPRRTPSNSHLSSSRYFNRWLPPLMTNPNDSPRPVQPHPGRPPGQLAILTGWLH